jgi:ABC-type nitrate/sulfonate/bicarbonate transport system substrate-binding protein
MKRRSVLALPAIASLSSLATRRAVAADKIKIGMLKPNIVTVIYWIAVKTGAFDKNGLNVVEYPFPSGQTVAGIEQLIPDGIDFYLGASGEVAHANSRYLEAGKAVPIALVEGGISSGSFFALRNDLKGKSLDELCTMKLRIGLSNPSSYHLILFRAFLRTKNLAIKDFPWSFLTIGGPEMLPAVVSHQLDGFMHDALTTTLAMRANACFEFMSSNRGDFGEDAKRLPGTGVCGNRAFMKAHPDVTTRFAQALRDASASYSNASKAEMVAVMAEWSRQDPAVIDAMYDRFDPRVGMTAAAADTWWNILGRAMLARGEISPKMTISDVFDLDYIQQQKS